MSEPDAVCEAEHKPCSLVDKYQSMPVCQFQMFSHLTGLATLSMKAMNLHNILKPYFLNFCMKWLTKNVIGLKET
jgi:hypothetical protein